MKFPAIELVDRYTIALVKHQRTNGANQAELDFYAEQMQEFDIPAIQGVVDQLVYVHNKIWDMEDDFKKRRVDGASLEEIGQKALDIRDLNNFRVQYKNRVAELVGCSVREIKQNHSSE